MYLLLIILMLLSIFCAVIFIRALTMRPYPLPEPLPGVIDFPREKAVDDLAALIRCKTVSSRDEALVNRDEFEKFYNTLKERFPLVHANCPLEKIGPAGLLYYWKGKESGDPIVLMSHFDVVPADEEHWEKPPFAGIIENEVLWGRGTLDTKATLCGILSSAEILLEKGFVPAHDIYFSFGGDEEIHGESCALIVSWFEKKGIHPALVVDEGGVIIEDVFPGVSAPCALIGIGEKGVLDLELSIKSSGGHASTPPPNTILGRLAKAAVRIEKKPFSGELVKPVAEMFDTLGRHSSFKYKLIFANLWCFLPILKLLGIRSGGNINAMMRTTCAVTRMEGSKAFNVLPTKATLGLNLRLLGKMTIDSAIVYLKKVIRNDDITFNIVNGSVASIYSDTNCTEYEILKKVIHTTWPNVLISPYLMMAASDSRHFLRITNRVYRFSAMKLSPEERAMIHSHNERIRLESLYKIVEFYLSLMQVV